MTGIVLAGGMSRRMGTDKAFLKISGVPMIEHVLRSLRSVVDHVIIVTNAPEAFASYGAKVVIDALAVPGPLTGIYSGLLESADECNFVVACDMPFLNPGLVSYLSGLAEGYDIVAPKINGLVEPLHAVYCRKLLPFIRKRIETDARKIQDLFSEARVRYVTEQEVDRFDPEHRSFMNLNTVEEYKEAACSDLDFRNSS